MIDGTFSAPWFHPMTPIDPSTLTAGVRLASAVFTRQGVKLLGAGTELTDEMVRTLLEAHRGDLFMADSIAELYSMHLVHEAHQQPMGRPAREDLVTVGGVLAVQSGEEVEQHHADAYELGAFGGRDPREDTRLRAQRLKLTEQLIVSRLHIWDRLRRTCHRDVTPLELPPTDAPGWPEPAKLARYREDRVDAFRRLLARLVAGVKTDAAAALEIVDELIEKQVQWPQRFVQLALLSHREPDYLPDHCFTMSVLSVAIATRLKFSYADVRLAGLSGLLSDVGMALVPREVRTTDRPLTEMEINRIWRHTAHSVVLLDALDGLPEDVRLAAYQHHERENGAGYPSGLRTAKITDFARIVAVADAFAAATEPRPYKPKKLPYHAIEELITVGSQKLYDRKVVRSLVESTGLFPVGSYVKLSSGEPAIVVGSHPEKLDRPIVQVLRRGHNAHRETDVVDLASYEPWEKFVVRAIDPPMELLRYLPHAA